MRAASLALLLLAPVDSLSVGTKGVLVVGSANVDLVAYTPRFPVAGETLMGNSFEQLPGGKGANQAVSAAKLGSTTRFIAQIGEDSMGDGSLSGYEAVGIDTQHIFRTSEAATGVAVITVDASSGNNQIIVCAGANGLLSPAHLDEAAEAFAQSRVLLTQLEVPVETTIAALRKGREAGCLTVCNTAPAPDGGLPDELLALTDVLCPNESEAALLTGRAPNAPNPHPKRNPRRFSSPALPPRTLPPTHACASSFTPPCLLAVRRSTGSADGDRRRVRGGGAHAARQGRRGGRDDPRRARRDARHARRRRDALRRPRGGDDRPDRRHDRCWCARIHTLGPALEDPSERRAARFASATHARLSRAKSRLVLLLTLTRALPRMRRPNADTGDAFLGALAHRLATDAPLASALPTALYAASLSVQRKGAQASYATSDELPEALRS